MIDIRSLPFARRHKRDYNAVITIEDPGLRQVKRLRFHQRPHPDHLVMRFEDIDHHDDGLAGPDEAHMAAALAFGRVHREESMLVHCHVGVSRSTAVGLGIIADRLGAGSENRAVAELMASNPDAAPNLVMLQMADSLLGRGGRLVSAWAETDEATQRMKDYRKSKGELLSGSRHLFARRPYCGYYPPARYGPTSLSPTSTDLPPIGGEIREP